MKEITLTISVIVDDRVPAEAVAQQIGDKINPDGWNWDVGYPAVTAERQL